MNNCIILVAHITTEDSLQVLNTCIQRMQIHAPNYPIILSASGNFTLLQQLQSVDHCIITTINSLESVQTSLHVFYKTSAWQLTYNIPAPRPYYGFAQLQKTTLAIQGARTLGYTQFLVMNYDAYLMEDGFVDYMFSEPSSVFFQFTGHQHRMSSDIFKLNMAGAEAMIHLTEHKTLYEEFTQRAEAGMLEDVLGHMIAHYGIPTRLFTAHNTEFLQLNPFKILINNSYNEGAMAGIVDNVVHVLVTHQGHPRYTLDGKLAIGYNGEFTEFDVSIPCAILHPITEYQGRDVNIIIRTSFGEFPVTLRADVLQNTHITFT